MEFMKSMEILITCNAMKNVQLDFFRAQKYPCPLFSKGTIPIPLCPLCFKPARPHTLFFDEQYNEEFYKKDTVLKKIEDMDCLIVVGTMLETNLASRIVGEAISHENCLVIEINPEPVIEYGNVHQLIGESEKIIPNLWKMVKLKFYEYKELQKQNYKN